MPRKPASGTQLPANNRADLRNPALTRPYLPEQFRAAQQPMSTADGGSSRPPQDVDHDSVLVSRQALERIMFDLRPLAQLAGPAAIFQLAGGVRVSIFLGVNGYSLKAD